MAETQVLGFGDGTAPVERKTKSEEDFLLLAVQATFDGSGAGSAFVPAVEIVSDAGHPVGTFPLGGSVAAGDSADVTFAPFLSGDGDGVKFDTYPQGGTYLYVTTTGHDPISGNGMTFFADKGIAVQSNQGVAIQSSGVGVSMNGDYLLQTTGTGAWNIQPGGNAQIEPGGDVLIEPLGQVYMSGTRVYLDVPEFGVFGVVPVSQPAHPVTLADVIAAGQALGLWA